MTTPSAAQSSACIRASDAAASIGTFDSKSWVTNAPNAIMAVASIKENNIDSARWRSTDTAADKIKMAISVGYCPSAITPAPISMLIAPAMGCPRAVAALFQMGLVSTPKGIIWRSIHMAGTAAKGTTGLATERKNEVSPGRMVRKRMKQRARCHTGNEAVRDRPIKEQDCRRSANQGDEKEAGVRHVNL